jgi:4-hydroxy-tetrahydrodipicolinate synthase
MIGTGTALITPFKKDLSIDFEALSNIIEHSIDGGVEYLVVLGTTGENATLNNTEKKKIYEFVSRQNKGRVQCVAGIGGNNTFEVVQSLKSFNIKGYDAILSVSPYYNKPNQEGIYQHYKAVCANSSIPIILYNVPSRTGSNINASTTLRIAKDFKNVIAIKEASANPEQFMDLLKYKEKKFNIISGDDNLTLPFLAMGMCGVISVIANAYPKEYSTMVRLGLNGNFSEARMLHYKLYDLMKAIFLDGNPGGVKYVMNKLKLCNNIVRPPLAIVNKSTQKAIDEVFTDL